jgi:hypothetical protein
MGEYYCMNSTELDNLVKGYIDFTYADEEAKEKRNLYSYFYTIKDLIFENPEIAWLIIKKVLKKDSSKKMMSLLAAGELESLLATHGNQFIDRVEEEAKKNPDFAKLLGGVWQNNISDENWKRIEKVCDRNWDK